MGLFNDGVPTLSTPIDDFFDSLNIDVAFGASTLLVAFVGLGVLFSGYYFIRRYV